MNFNKLIKEEMESYDRSWNQHKKANPKKFKHSFRCKVCGFKFNVTEKKNIIKKDIFIHSGNVDEKNGNVFLGGKERDVLDKATKVIAKCPNCDYIDKDNLELFCIPDPEKRKYYRSWRRRGY